QLVKVHHVDSQTELGCGLRVSGRKLLEVMIEEEVEGIFGIGINQNQVSIVHRELAKTKRCPAVRHEIACAYSMSRAPAVPKDLYDLSVFRGDAGQLAANLRWRKNLFRIKDYVVFFCCNAFDLSCIDQVCKFHSKQIHEALHR